LSGVRFPPNLTTSAAEAGRAAANESARALGNSFASFSHLAA
jgi:hypothetical protein